jgi:alcohol dehydrogenase class IV
VEHAAEICRERKCDCIVAVGGGSAIDLAKAVAVLATNAGRASDFYGSGKYSAEPLPLVAIPTTSGTGAEVTPYSVLVDREANDKRTIGGEALFPRVALLDPALTVSMPRSVTIHTGLDALSQGIEGILSTKATPMTDALGLEVIRLVKRWLPIAAEEPEHLEARSQMLYAAMLSGVVVAHTGTTLVHGMGYLYTTEFGIAHGLANALLLPPLLEYDARYAPDKMAAIAEALGHPEASQPGRVCAQEIRDFVRSLGLSPAAGEHGVSDDASGGFAARIGANPTRFKNQLGAPDAKNIAGFYDASIRGVVNY